MLNKTQTLAPSPSKPSQHNLTQLISLVSHALPISLYSDVPESMTVEGGVCGRRPPKSTTTVLTGRSDVDAPWTVSIGDTHYGGYEHNCGGSIVGVNSVLTAGHCITGPDFYVDTFVVVAGVFDLKHADRKMQFKIEKAVLHPRWQKENQRHVYFDAGLIFTKEQFKYSPTIQPVCLPSLGHEQLPENLVGDSVTVVGWGRNHEDEHSQELIQIDVTLRSDKECDTKYNRSLTRIQQLQIKNELPLLLQPSQFCTRHGKSLKYRRDPNFSPKNSTHTANYTTFLKLRQRLQIQ